MLNDGQSTGMMFKLCLLKCHPVKKHNLSAQFISLLMRSFCFITLFFCSFVCHGQDLLIPYQQGKKVGLADVNGKLKIPATFDQVKWIVDRYFETSSKIYFSDTFQTSGGKTIIRKDSVLSKGIIYNGRQLPLKELYSKFEILPGKCIIAKNENRNYGLGKERYNRLNRKEKFISLINLKGENVYPDNFKRIQKFDTTGSLSKDKRMSRYILFGSQDFEERYSLFVFDIEKQQISEWLLKNVERLKVTDAEYRHKMIRFEYKDDLGNAIEKLVQYKSGKFVIESLPPRPKSLESTGNYQGSGDGNGQRDYSETMVEEPRDERIVIKGTEPNFTAYLNQVNDSLFYVTNWNEKTHIPLPGDLRLVFTDERNKRQEMPVIYKQQNRFGLIEQGKIGKALYDSLVYFGNGYIACRSKEAGSGCGTLNKDGQPVVPFVYDSIGGDVLQLVVENGKDYQRDSAFFTLKEKGRRYESKIIKPNPYVKTAAASLLVYKNGKAGVINNLNELIIPIAYDEIFENGMDYIKPQKAGFYILKNKGLYGITWLMYNKDVKHYEMQQTIEPVFEHIPCFVYINYYGISGSLLIGLYDDAFRFIGFAGKDGRKYYGK